MNVEKLERLEDDCISKVFKNTPYINSREIVEHFVLQKTNEMIDSGDIITLSEDEEDMILKYRQFKRRTKPGEFFSWKSPLDYKLVISDTPSLIIDPREVKELV